PATPAPSGGALYRVQVGAYTQKANAEAMVARLKKAGFDAIIVTGGTAPAPAKPAPAPAKPAIKKGSKVRVKPGAKDYDGRTLASFVYGQTYDVIRITGDRVVIGQGKVVTAAVKMKDLVVV
ncbi:MAG TPA: SPOR domain-containing protein, partial [Bacillota bacterium]|nr:SPOR domain-containing protein [Bacillota bacterium]